MARSSYSFFFSVWNALENIIDMVAYKQFWNEFRVVEKLGLAEEAQRKPMLWYN
ncbi:hypothetical protein CHS0354_005972, partial [Potamilus streckersoni]